MGFQLRFYPANVPLKKKKKKKKKHVFWKPFILIPNTLENNYNMFLQQLKKLISQSFL